MRRTRRAVGLVTLAALGILGGCTDDEAPAERGKSSAEARSDEALAASYATSVCGHMSACGDVAFTSSEPGPIEGSRTAPLSPGERPACEGSRREELLALLRCSRPTETEREGVVACVAAYAANDCPTDEQIRSCARALNGDTEADCPVFEERAACDVLLLLAERCPKSTAGGAAGAASP